MYYILYIIIIYVGLYNLICLSVRLFCDLCQKDWNYCQTFTSR